MSAFERAAEASYLETLAQAGARSKEYPDWHNAPDDVKDAVRKTVRASLLAIRNPEWVGVDCAMGEALIRNEEMIPAGLMDAYRAAIDAILEGRG